ncbi:MAG TPA: hypothetical protein VME43_31835 [Bryobacteraceae bacterium]|nr:hypothetical protein [Bryobacteraceae bacterium]
MKPNEETAIRCPRCGGADVRKSLTKHLLDYIPQIFGFTALRCRRCRHRFYRRLWEDGEEDEGTEDQ